MNRAMKLAIKAAAIMGAILLPISTKAQTSVALMPVTHMQFLDNNGKPLASGCVFTYQAGTTTPQATYIDSTGTAQNTNPIILNAGGFGDIWLAALSYKIKVVSFGGTNCASGVTQYTIDGVVEQGLINLTKSVVLSPTGGGLQTITGPLKATYFQQSQAGITSPGVRVGILDPTTILQTASNPPNLITTQPGAASQNYTIPDPGSSGNFVMNPVAGGGGNTLNCTVAGISCVRTAYIYFEGAGCNNTTPGLGWDTFGTNSPTPICVTGSNIQKGVMAFPAAMTHIQKNTGTSAAAGTITTTYPAATTAGNLLVATIAFDGTHTITGCTDGTNAYTQDKHVANGALSVDVWSFHGTSTGMAAASTLTCTYNVASNGAIIWHEYSGSTGPATPDVTVSNTGASTAVTTGTTAGLAQSVELVLAFGGALTAPTMVNAAAGYTDHGKVSQSTNVTVDDAGIIAQTNAGQSGSFTLGSSQTWAAGVVTYKASVGSIATAQRAVGLPSYYLASQPVNAAIKWQVPLLPTGNVNTVLGTALTCTVDGNTDDNAFNAATTATIATPISAAGVITTTPLNGVAATGCAANSNLHWQIQRLRYNAADTYEGFVYVNGAGLYFGVSQ